NTIRLSIKEFELLQTLMTNTRHELTTEYLLEHVWGAEPDAVSDTLWLYVSYLNGKLRAVASKVRISGERGGSFILSRNPS
ncbi:MAG: winged helix-turn-helix domain-containing protein, partial [Firmicutes bacterium]|nr:winged helix-turn-helix domain-containing protein [Bacillota bacterium]